MVFSSSDADNDFQLKLDLAAVVCRKHQGAGGWTSEAEQVQCNVLFTKQITGRWSNQENTNEGQKFKTANKENKNPREKVTHNRVAETQQTKTIKKTQT